MRHALLTTLAALMLSACNCSTSGATIGGRLPDGGLVSADGGPITTGLDGSVQFTGTLLISPRDPVLTLTTGQPPPTVQFTATANGTAVTPQWAIIPPEIGTIDGNGTFTASPLGGLATVTANYGTATDSTTVSVKVRLTQNGNTGGAMDAGAGGFGGVGGEGIGGPVDPATLTVLAGTPTSDGAALIYPYDATVWPRGMLAPLLQWTPAHAYDAVAISLECPTFTFTGTFAKTATPFLHHPIPQAAWDAMSTTCAGQSVQLKVVFASGGQAYGALTQTWRIANGSLKGIVYYNSYGTRLAKNYNGALGPDPLFGGATLSIRGGSTDPTLVAGGNGTEANCRVCHVVSADGSTMIAQRGDQNSATSEYALRNNNTETPMSPTDGRFAWGGLSPDGKLLFSNAGPIQGASTAPSALYQVPSGTPVTTTGLPSGLTAATPVFSADGKQLAFNWYGGTVAAMTGDQRTLATMRFTAPGTFSDFTPIFTPPSGQTALYPSYMPTGTSVVFELETLTNGRFGETRSTCDGSGPCSDIGARGELWWIDLATRQVHGLDKLNGKGFLPTGPNAHGDDTSLNYEPTVGPIASGGYAWVIFTSRRLYGNVATMNPWWSDPRFHDLSVGPTPKKLWVAAIDLNAPPGTDPSHPAFYLPAQELMAGNSRGYWSADPCLGDGESCGSGDQCCGGYCVQDQTSQPQCSSMPPTCAREFDRCTTAANCCDPAALCIASRCTLIQ